MNKNQYISMLENKINCLPPEYSSEILDYYKEHFQEGISIGKSEAEIAHELGTVDTVANSIIAEFYMSNTDEVNSLKTFSKGVISASNLGAGTLNIFTASTYTLSLIITIPTLYIASAIMLVTPPVSLGLHLINPELPISFGIDFLPFEILITAILAFIGWKSFKALNKFSPKLISKAFASIIQKSPLTKIKH